jgi:hypothetical protein
MYEIRSKGLTAELVTVISLIGLIGVTAIVIIGNEIAIVSGHATDRSPTLFVLATVLPLIATWVGGAIAYSFSSSNFALALNAANRFASTRSPADETAVADAMIDRKQFIETITLGAARSINIKKTLLGMFGPQVTRIPVVNDNGAIAYVIHEIAVHKFLTKIALDHPTDLTLGNATLHDLLTDADLSPTLKRYVVVSSSCTLSDAKRMMAAEPSCQDVFVTQTGRPGEEILGWVTDTRLAEYARV